MQIKATIVTTASSLALVVGLFLSPVATATDEKKKLTPVEEGKELAFNRKKGNCLACHAMDDGTLPGTIGPPLLAMKARYPDKAKLFDQIWDARSKNPNTIMPPFGPHKIISKGDIEKIVEYIHTL